MPPKVVVPTCRPLRGRGSGRTAEEVQDRVTGVRAFRALWSRLSSYAVPVVSHVMAEEKPERSWSCGVPWGGAAQRQRLQAG